MGRYISADPAQEGLNLYAYVFNNPNGFVDPRGLCALRKIASFGLDLIGFNEDTFQQGKDRWGALLNGDWEGFWGTFEESALTFQKLVESGQLDNLVIGFSGGIKFVRNGLSNNIIRLAEANIKNTGKTVLGHYPGYIYKAKKIGASYFDIGKIWDLLSDAQRETANIHFLNKIAAKGDQIYLSTAKKGIRLPSQLAKEIKRLIENKGYQWINQWSLKRR